MYPGESPESARARGLECSDAAPHVDERKEEAPVSRSVFVRRDGSPSEVVQQRTHADLVNRLIEDRKKADAASAEEHAAHASSAVGKKSVDVPDGNIYLRKE
jgi:hypothetical protein